MMKLLKLSKIVILWKVKLQKIQELIDKFVKIPTFWNIVIILELLFRRNYKKT